MSDFKAFVYVFLFSIFVMVTILLMVAYDAKDEEKLVVVPLCVDLDSAGYDGLYSCIDQDGEIVRPGEN